MASCSQTSLDAALYASFECYIGNQVCFARSISVLSFYCRELHQQPSEMPVVADMSWHISSWIACALTDFSQSWQLRDRLSTWLHTCNPAASFIQHSVGLAAVTQHSCTLLPPVQSFSSAICQSSCSSPADLQYVCYLVFCNTICLHSRSCLAHLCWHAVFDRGSRVDMHNLLGATKLTCKIC